MNCGFSKLLTLINDDNVSRKDNIEVTPYASGNDPKLILLYTLLLQIKIRAFCLCCQINIKECMIIFNLYYPQHIYYIIYKICLPRSITLALIFRIMWLSSHFTKLALVGVKEKSSLGQLSPLCWRAWDGHPTPTWGKNFNI